MRRKGGRRTRPPFTTDLLVLVTYIFAVVLLTAVSG